jgi:hypothetical protein
LQLVIVWFVVAKYIKPSSLKISIHLSISFQEVNQRLPELLKSDVNKKER